MLRIAPDAAAREELALTLDEICCSGAQRMLAMALEVEVQAHLEARRQARDEHGHVLGVRNGHARTRRVMIGAGAIDVTAPRVDDARIDPTTGKRARFRSSILPPWARRSPKGGEVLPLLYLHGLSTSDFVPCLWSSNHVGRWTTKRVGHPQLHEALVTASPPSRRSSIRSFRR
jgi:hypothetical protein